MAVVDELDVSTQTRVIISNERLHRVYLYAAGVAVRSNVGAHGGGGGGEGEGGGKAEVPSNRGEGGGARK